MKPWIAVALLIPIVTGLAVMIPRPSAPPAEPVVASPAPKTEAPEEEAPPLDLRLEEMTRRAVEREKAVERLEADYEERVERLIESIDWTRAESRARFPIEYELIRSDFDRALESNR